MQLESLPVEIWIIGYKSAATMTMVEVARGLGKQTVAEFVENKATMQLLSEYGVDFGQGYYIGKPFIFSEKPSKRKD